MKTQEQIREDIQWYQEEIKLLEEKLEKHARILATGLKGYDLQGVVDKDGNPVVSRVMDFVSHAIKDMEYWQSRVDFYKDRIMMLNWILRDED